MATHPYSILPGQTTQPLYNMHSNKHYDTACLCITINRRPFKGSTISSWPITVLQSPPDKYQRHTTGAAPPSGREHRNIQNTHMTHGHNNVNVIHVQYRMHNITVLQPKTQYISSKYSKVQFQCSSLVHYPSITNTCDEGSQDIFYMRLCIITFHHSGVWW